jgi:N-acetylmuramoyl-L-alanine amidase
VIVDLPEVAFQLPSGLGAKGRGLISAYRYGRLEEGRSRIVMDVTGPVLIEKSFIVPPEAGQPARMVVDLIATDPQTFEVRLKPEPALAAASPAAVPVPELAAAPAPDPHPTETPATAPQAEATAMTALEGSTVMPPPASGAEIAALPMPLPATEPPAGAPSPSSAVPQGKKVIVLDPGHGGLDPGAASSAGTLEKDVVLALAIAMRDAIAATGRYEVKLTREGDTFVSLPDRVRFARQNRADLFIALHADSLRGPTVRGATVYTLSEKASDKEAEALAEKENRADIIAGVDLGGDSEEIAGILIDLAQRETKNASVSLAKRIVSELEGVTGLTGQPHRSAGFRVLRAPDVPSVLLEAGYLSSRQDEALLTSPEWRKEVAGALVEALDAYFGVTVAQDQ